MNLEDLRKRIDDVDAKIVELIGERLRIVEEIGRGKKKQKKFIEDKRREDKVLETVKSIARRENISQDAVESIYKQIMAACKGIQGMEVAFQGEIGAYSEEAVFRFFGPSIQIRPRESLEDVFKAVEREEVQFGVVPIENSLEGIISRVYDLLLDSILMVCGDI